MRQYDLAIDGASEIGFNMGEPCIDSILERSHRILDGVSLYAAMTDPNRF
jgi:hypothetical protein